MGFIVAASMAPAVAKSVRVARIVQADELLLADGRTVRLASVVVPDLPETVQTAAHELVSAFARHALELEEVGSSDRYGRLLVSVRDAEGHDLRVRLLQAGLAVVRTGEQPDGVVRDLLGEEAVGRRDGQGVWGALDHAAVTPATIVGRIGRFALLEGVVVSVAERWEATFLDFGADWRTDFTIRIRKEDRARFDAAGLPLMQLVGRKVVARGWPFMASGPMLEVRDPLELQPVP